MKGADARPVQLNQREIRKQTTSASEHGRVMPRGPPLVVRAVFLCVNLKASPEGTRRASAVDHRFVCSIVESWRTLTPHPIVGVFHMFHYRLVRRLGTTRMGVRMVVPERSQPIQLRAPAHICAGTLIFHIRRSPSDGSGFHVNLSWIALFVVVKVGRRRVLIEDICRKKVSEALAHGAGIRDLHLQCMAAGGSRTVELTNGVLSGVL